MSGNATLEALSIYTLPGTRLTLLECLVCDAAIGVMKDGIFKQLRKPKEPPLWHSSGVPVGTPWVGQQPLELVAAGSINRPSFKFVLKIRASGGAHKKHANPDRLNFHVAEHIKAALGDLLLSLDVFNSQQHLSSVPVVVMDYKTRQVFLSFPCATQPKFRYELPSSAASNNGKEPAQSNSPVLRNTCGKKRKAARLAGADDALPPLSLHEDVPDMMQDDFDADAAFAEMNLEPSYHCEYTAWEALDAMQKPHLPQNEFIDTDLQDAGQLPSAPEPLRGAFAFGDISTTATASAGAASGASSCADDPWAMALSHGPPRDALIAKDCKDATVRRLKPFSKRVYDRVLSCESQKCVSPSREFTWNVDAQRQAHLRHLPPPTMCQGCRIAVGLSNIQQPTSAASSGGRC